MASAYSLMPATGLANAFWLDMRAKMHVGEVNPHKKGRVCLCLSLDVVRRPLRHVVVDGFHSLFGQRSGVFDDLLANSSETRINGRVVTIGLALQSKTPRGPYFARNAGSFG